MNWDLTTDIIVVGAGYAGVRAAIASYDHGSEVLVIEKMSHAGGISVMSGGAVLFVEEVKAALPYFRCLSGNRVSDEMIVAFAEGLAENFRDVQELSKISGASLFVRDRRGIYQFPGREVLNSVVVSHVPGFKEFNWYPSSPKYNGAKLMAVLLDNIKHRKIPVKYDIAAKNLILNKDRKIVGIAAECGGNLLNLQARKAVILACGGFEFDEWAKLQFFEAKPFYAMGSTSSTGDGLRMAQAVGARMWHMWHTHNSYGFKYKEFPMAFRHCFGGSLATHGGQKKIQRMPWIVVDKVGRRFMNEFHPAPQDTGARPLSYFDPDLPGFPRIPCYLIFDDNGRQLRPFGLPLGYPEDFPSGERYKWSRDNSTEIEKGWIIQGSSIKELAQKIKNLPNNENKISSSLLEETINKWNKIVGSGVDDDFKRNPGTMMPINTPPYYAMEAWPVVTNTQGGPEHNLNRQVLDAWGNPIPRLYTAGELGSFFGHLYELSGNIGECFSSGRIAGKNAAEEKVIKF